MYVIIGYILLIPLMICAALCTLASSYSIKGGARRSVGILTCSILGGAMIAVGYLLAFMGFKETTFEGGKLITTAYTVPVAGWIHLLAGGFFITYGNFYSALAVPKKDFNIKQKEVPPQDTKPLVNARIEKIEPDANDTASTVDHLSRAFIYEDMGEYDKSIAEYTKAIELNMNLALSYLRRGSILMLQGKNKEAIADFERVVDLSESTELTQMATEHIGRLK